MLAKQWYKWIYLLCLVALTDAFLQNICKIGDNRGYKTIPHRKILSLHHHHKITEDKDSSLTSNLSDPPLPTFPSWIRETSIAISIICFCSVLPLPSYASGGQSANVFNHEYADPLHPYCDRKIEVSNDGTSFHYSGTAVGSKDDNVRRGCSKEEVNLYTLRKGAFDGIILNDDTGVPRISAGDGIHEGVWEPKNTADTNLGYEDVDGIRWNDGNKWIIKSQSYVSKSGADGSNQVIKKPLKIMIGEFVFYSYIGFSTLAGAYGVINGAKKKQQQA